MKSLYTYLDYRSYLKDWTQAQPNPRGLLSHMAESISCQNSHVTRILKEEVHLTLDQAYLLTGFLNFTQAEENYFLKLVEYNRASNFKYKEKLKSELNHLKFDQEDLAKRFQENEIKQAELVMQYYSEWKWIAIHTLTAIKRYQNPKNIANKLKCDEKEVKEYLEKLYQAGLVQKKGDYWVHSGVSLHLPQLSPMISTHHTNWRNQAILESQKKNAESIHYTVVQSISQADYENIKQVLLGAIDKYKKIAGPSDSEELICLNLDYFKL